MQHLVSSSQSVAFRCTGWERTLSFLSQPVHRTPTDWEDNIRDAVLCCGLEKNGMVGGWHGHGMASVNQTRPHCVNQMGKTHSKHLAARNRRGTAWARHGNGMLYVNRPLYPVKSLVSCDQLRRPRTPELLTLPPILTSCHLYQTDDSDGLYPDLLNRGL